MNMSVAELLPRFSSLRVAVVGDAMLDRYIAGTTRRLCQEAPVPVVDVADERLMPGGAGNVAANLVTLGAQVSLISILGDDCEGRELISRLERAGVDVAHITTCQTRRTLSKTRVSSDGQLVARVDQGSTREVSEDCEGQLVKALDAIIDDCDALVFSDYGYGVLTNSLIALLKRRLDTTHRPTVVVDAKDLERYRVLSPTAVKPNYAQVRRLLPDMQFQDTLPRWQQIKGLGTALLERTGADLVAATLDCDGALLFTGDRPPYRTHATPSPASNTAGAGDTYLAALTLALAAGAGPEASAELAAVAADVVVHQSHTACCRTEDLVRRFQGEPVENTKRSALHQVLVKYRRDRRRIVLTNGCFDILHRGHITYLEQARSLGDILIVGVNSDESIHRLKGPDRPINSLEDRLRVLGALSCVDYLVSFDEDTPHRLIEAIRPDVFVKGGDYTRDTLPEASLVEELGGTVRILPFIEGRSTTKIIQQIVNRHPSTQPAAV